MSLALIRVCAHEFCKFRVRALVWLYPTDEHRCCGGHDCEEEL